MQRLYLHREVMKKGHADTAYSLEQAHAAIAAELKPLA
jgi:hypothetical protein